MDKQMIEEMARIIAFDLCPKRRIHANYGEEAQCYSDNNFAECKEIKNVVDKLINAGYRKIPENAVMLTREEYERFQRIENTIKRISTVSPTEAEAENKALKETIGIVLAQKRNIWKSYNRLKEECVKTRKETAEKFARLVEFHSVSTRDEEGREIFTISALGLKEILHEEFGIPYDEIAKEITGEKYVECHKCKNKWDCERTYLQGYMDGESEE